MEIAPNAAHFFAGHQFGASLSGAPNPAPSRASPNPAAGPTGPVAQVVRAHA